METNTERYDLVIIGGGPAGLSAGIYMARAQYRTLIIEREKIGGQIAITSDVVNYPGVFRTDGASLTKTMRQQAEQFGAEFLTANVTQVELTGNFKQITTDRGTVAAIGVLFATGAVPRMAGFRGEAEYRGRGVAYCATCDGEFFSGKDIFVIGGGFSAAQEALFLTKYGKRVTICIRRDHFSCAKSVAEKVMAHPKIRVLFHTELIEAGGGSLLQYALLKNNQTGEVTRYEAPKGDTFGIFVFTGYQPQTELFRGKLALTEQGYLMTDRTQKTSLDGVYGAGDVCDKALRQVVTAVSDGAVAATALERYAANIHEKYEIPAFSVRVRKNTPQSATPLKTKATPSSFFSPAIRSQLETLFGHLKRKLILRVYTDSSPLSASMYAFTREICHISPMLQLESVPIQHSAQKPHIAFCAENGTSMGFSFYGVPGGHELNSFALSIYNAVGKGQVLSAAALEKIKLLPKTHLIIAVTLSCTMCPSTVMAAGQIAFHHSQVRADIVDVKHNAALREKYQIMSVPCIIVNGKVAGFGEKNVDELLDLLGSC